MKIEEAKIRLEEIKTYTHGFYRDVLIKKRDAKVLLDQLDQPKPVVPQFVADWIEKYKEKRCRLYHALEHVFDDVELSLYIKQQEGDYTEIIAKAWLYGYIVQKEKLYTVEIPTNSEAKLALVRREDKKIVITIIGEGERWRRSDSFQLTEQEIRKDFDWAWQQGFAKEVTE